MIAVVDSGNDFSLLNALRRVGAREAELALTADPDVVRRASAVVVPGQGAIGDFMSSLRSRGLDRVLRDVIAAGTPYLGICLGMQALYDESEENGGVAGLGVIAGRVERFRPADRSLKVPHMGWSDVRVRGGGLAGIPDGAHFYFVHSYFAPVDATTVLACEYGVPFAAAVRTRNVVGVQFHPEKSQTHGLALLAHFVTSLAEAR